MLCSKGCHACGPPNAPAQSRLRQQRGSGPALHVGTFRSCPSTWPGLSPTRTITAAGTDSPGATNIRPPLIHPRLLPRPARPVQSAPTIQSSVARYSNLQQLLQVTSGGLHTVTHCYTLLRPRCCTSRFPSCRADELRAPRQTLLEEAATLSSSQKVVLGISHVIVRVCVMWAPFQDPKS